MRQSDFPPPAPLTDRALAAIIDGIIVAAPLLYAVHEWGEVLSGDRRGFEGAEGFVVGSVVLSYWVFLEWAFGCTPGKALFGLRVVTLTGDDISFGQSLKRNVLRILDSGFGYLVGFLVAYYNPKRQRLGDLWAQTLVVSTRTLRLFKQAAHPQSEAR